MCKLSNLCWKDRQKERKAGRLSRVSQNLKKKKLLCDTGNRTGDRSLSKHTFCPFATTKKHPFDIYRPFIGIVR